MQLQDASSIHRRSVELLQRLIRFNTTNPPGNERECIEYIGALCSEAGLEPRYFSRSSERPNLVCRLRGRGEAPPLLMYGHVDVVPTEGQKWSHPPFSGSLIDGEIWGRGALDMKGGLAMMLSAVLRAKAEGFEPRGDVLLAAVADEEGGGEFGSLFLVREHPDLFRDVLYAIGEFGGCPLTIGGKRFFPIMVAEKHTCWTKVTLKGPAGHGALLMRHGTMAGLSRFLNALDRSSLPIHVTPAASRMVKTMARYMPWHSRLLLHLMLKPSLTDLTLKILGPAGDILAPMLRNTANATVVRGGDADAPNVVPAQVQVVLDGRLLPGFSSKEFLGELRAIAKDIQIDLEVMKEEDSGPAEPDMELFSTLASILEESEPGATALPVLFPAVTDGRHFSRLGIQTYGFTPMNLPEDMEFTKLVHAADERVPVTAIEFGAKALFRLLQRY